MRFLSSEQEMNTRVKMIIKSPAVEMENTIAGTQTVVFVKKSKAEACGERDESS